MSCAGTNFTLIKAINCSLTLLPGLKYSDQIILYPEPLEIPFVCAFMIC